MKSNAEQRYVKCENGEISYWLTRKPVKNLNLRIKPDGKVLVSANNRVPLKFIDDFIESKQKFILSALEMYEEKRKLTQKEGHKYISGESFELLGKSLRLKVEESEKEDVYTDGVHIFLMVNDKDNFRHKEIMMTKWIKDYQIRVFNELIHTEYRRFRKYGVPYPELKVRYMTSRWGSCHPKKGIITLNSQLIEAPINCIEYVILHEFAHFIYPNHSKQFWDFVSILMPDWKERKNELEKIL